MTSEEMIHILIISAHRLLNLTFILFFLFNIKLNYITYNWGLNDVTLGI